MHWIFLILGGIMEIGWPLGLKMSQTKEQKVFWIVFSILSMAASGFFLWLAQKEIPMGTAYAVWTGIGAAGAFIAGIYLFDDAAGMIRIISVTLIILGVVGLRVAA